MTRLSPCDATRPRRANWPPPAQRVGASLVYISTNEVFDGRRTDGVAYTEADPAAPINPYGVSKLEGEQLATKAFSRTGADSNLWIVRTAWLFGPPGNDFPHKILAAADRLAGGGGPGGRRR